MEKALNSLPTSEIEAYKQIMARIRAGTSHTSVTAIRTLIWIFHAARPLRMDELLEALYIEERLSGIDGNQKFVSVDIIEMCHSLVVYDEPSGIVRFSHITVQEFLKSRKLPVINLAKTCLAYLEYNAFNCICSNKKSMEIRIQTYRFCLYAARFWGFHVRGEAESLSCVQRTIFRLLASENKRNSIVQMAEYAYSRRGLPSFTEGQTALHIVATNGLATVCKHLLDRQPRYALYVYETDQRIECQCHGESGNG